jgi:hypothetical protein
MTANTLSHVLVGYLLAGPAGRWPGADGMVTADVLREYPAAAAARLVPGELDLCDRHPELAAQIVSFFFLTIADALDA